MYLREAVTIHLQESPAPIVTEYDIYKLGQALTRNRVFRGKPVTSKFSTWDRRRCVSLIQSLERYKVLVADRDFKSGVWRVLNASTAGVADEVCCLADPFLYVSHLSAFQRYGWTERSPIALVVTRPSRSVWNLMRDNLLRSDGVTYDDIVPPLLRVTLTETVRRRNVRVHETKYPALPVAMRGEFTRISKPARTLVDALDRPDLCGGINHVLDVWREQAPKYVSKIFDELETHHSPIVKVRAGYILDEILNVGDPRVSALRLYAQRGSSRKLDPDAPFASRFSENWMLSINV